MEIFGPLKSLLWASHPENFIFEVFLVLKVFLFVWIIDKSAFVVELKVGNKNSENHSICERDVPI